MFSRSGQEFCLDGADQGENLKGEGTPNQVKGRHTTTCSRHNVDRKNGKNIGDITNRGAGSGKGEKKKKKRRDRPRTDRV